MRKLKALALTGLVVGAVTVVGAAPAQAALPTASPDFCWTVAYAPTYSASGQIVYEGGVQCYGNVRDLDVSVELEVDGSFAASTDKECSGVSRCFDLGLYPNRSGNQKWCTVVYAIHLSTRRTCETAGF
ncbi:hypothetical protein [Dactylosporangium sp. NPDC000521]|uniref:hypothetical protein n=1 Tax=Dactylosporangium sp. NPDC000521 TaxID=3363975 RepID=UPI00369ED20C